MLSLTEIKPLDPYIYQGLVESYLANLFCYKIVNGDNVMSFLLIISLITNLFTWQFFFRINDVRFRRIWGLGDTNANLAEFHKSMSIS